MGRTRTQGRDIGGLLRLVRRRTRSAALYFVCSDMWKPYLKVVAERAGQAVQVLDRFHI